MEITVNQVLGQSLLIIGTKRTMYLKEKDNLDTLVLGSSHGDWGFNPAYFPNSFNFCCRSQDLKHSYLIYKKITENNNNITNLVLFYSVFSPGCFLEKSPGEKYISPALNELLSLNIEYEDQELKNEFEKIRNKLDTFTYNLSGFNGFLPNDFKAFYPESYGAEKKANDHMRFNNKEEANLYLIRTLLLAKKMKHKICIVVPPARSDYKKATGMEFNALFKSLLEILNNFHLDYNCKLINGFDSELFSDNHFGDYDHLHPLGKGTEILTEMIFRNFSHT